MIYSKEQIINNVFHGDSLEITKRFPDNIVDLIIIDPPYLTSDEKWDKEEEFSEALVNELFRVSKKSASLYVFCGIGEKSQSLLRWFPILKKYWHFKDLITWKKQRGNGNRRGWLYTREEILWFVKNNNSFIWNKEKQYNTEKRAYIVNSKYKNIDNKRHTNVWIDIYENTLGSSVKHSKLFKNRIFHFSPKPLLLLDRIIELHTKEGDLVYDCFAGSGSSLLSAKRLKRNFCGVELNEKYYNLIKERLNSLKI